MVEINFIFITTTRMTVIHYISTHSSETMIFTLKFTKSSAPLLRCSVTQSCPTLWCHGSQHAKLICPSVSPGVCSDSCPLSQWCSLTISSSAATFSSCLQSFQALRLFPMNQLFPSGGQSIGTSVSASALPMNIQGWFPLGLTSLIFLQTKRLSSVFSSTTVRKHQFFGIRPSFWSNSHICTWLVGKL